MHFGTAIVAVLCTVKDSGKTSGACFDKQRRFAELAAAGTGLHIATALGARKSLGTSRRIGQQEQLPASTARLGSCRTTGYVVTTFTRWTLNNHAFFYFSMSRELR
tara:strand:- start:71465 stop:71782 length:318 start_codon:yes stop_codon:yes gene_type:complete